MTWIPMTSTSSLEITVENSGMNVLLCVNGRINVDSSPDLRDSLRAILSTEPLPRTVIVDLARISYMETSGIATLIEALRIARHHQIGFWLRGLGGSVLRLFEVTGALTLFDPGGDEGNVS